MIRQEQDNSSQNSNQNGQKVNGIGQNIFDFDDNYSLFNPIQGMKSEENIDRTLRSQIVCSEKEAYRISYQSQSSENLSGEQQLNGEQQQVKRRRRRNPVPVTPEYEQKRSQEHMIKQKHRDVVWAIIKECFIDPLLIPGDEQSRKKFYHSCFVQHKKSRGSDFRIFQAYARPWIFGKLKQVEILRKIRQGVTKQIDEVLLLGETMFENQPIARDAYVRWLKAHCFCLQILIKKIPGIKEEGERKQIVQQAINCYQEKGGWIKKRRQHGGSARNCLNKYLDVLKQE